MLFHTTKFLGILHTRLISRPSPTSSSSRSSLTTNPSIGSLSMSPSQLSSSPLQISGCATQAFGVSLGLLPPPPPPPPPLGLDGHCLVSVQTGIPSRPLLNCSSLTESASICSPTGELGEIAHVVMVKSPQLLASRRSALTIVAATGYAVAPAAIFNSAAISC